MFGVAAAGVCVCTCVFGVAAAGVCVFSCAVVVCSMSQQLVCVCVYLCCSCVFGVAAAGVCVLDWLLPSVGRSSRAGTAKNHTQTHTINSMWRSSAEVSCRPGSKVTLCWACLWACPSFRRELRSLWNPAS